MKLVFYSIVLNHHQACLADELYRILGKDYAFVETAQCKDKKGSIENYSNRPYLIKAWESNVLWYKAMQLATTTEVCVFGGYEALPFEKARLHVNLLSFEMGERMLKRGWLNLASPRILKMITAYHLGGWSKKKLYKLCMSAYTASDQYRLLSFKGKCYKWGYFTQVNEKLDVEAVKLDASTSEITPLMWCSRFLKLKHPELPVLMAKKLKERGFRFVISMFGDEGNAGKSDAVYSRQKLKTLILKLGVEDCVHLIGNKPNREIIKAMQNNSIFLFTSDRYEGWGAVANESMANGCVLVASEAIGSTPYLVTDGYNGFKFKSCDVDSLTEKVEWIFNHPTNMRAMQHNAYNKMRNIWSPKHAAESLLQLISHLQNGEETSIKEGPGSKA